jgi:hypothetical protein
MVREMGYRRAMNMIVNGLPDHKCTDTDGRTP